MKLFAISDLHLSGANPKPMDKFGWYGYWEHIQNDWRARVGAEDTVLIAGDISWAMYLPDALVDIAQIGALPGKKVLLRGNHDYWWSSLSRLRQVLPENMYALQNDCLCLGDFVFGGTRGWSCLESGSAEDEKIYARELLRLQLSLEAMRKSGGERERVVMVHYPPFDERQQDTPVTRLLQGYDISLVVYGHLHGVSLHGAYNGVRDGIEYRCTSCDGLGFTLLQLR